MQRSFRMFRLRARLSMDGRHDRDVRREVTVATGANTTPEGEAKHRHEIFLQFCNRFTQKVKEAEEYLELVDLIDESTDDYIVTADELFEEQSQRWHCGKCILRDALEHIWPEIESLAIKLGVPYESQMIDLWDDEHD